VKPADSRNRRHTFLLAALAAALLAVAVPPAGARPLLKAFWGPDQRNGVSQFPVYADLGVDVYQTQLRWDQIAPVRPVDPEDPGDPAYRWPPGLDRILQEASDHRMEVLLMLFGAPPWANGGRPPIWAPDQPADFAAFATAASRRYPAVRRWMIWGEPLRASNFQPMVPQRKREWARPLTPAQARAPERYAEMLDAAYGAIRKVDGNAIVIGGNTDTVGDIGVYNWVRYMRLRGGRRPRMDAFGHNPFPLRRPSLRNPPGPLGSYDVSDLKRLTQLLDKYQTRGLPIFVSEFTIPTDAPDAEFNYFATRAVQARWLRAAFRVARRTGRVDGFGWVRLYDEPALNLHTGLLDETGAAKPAYYVFKRE